MSTSWIMNFLFSTKNNNENLDDSTNEKEKERIRKLRLKRLEASTTTADYKQNSKKDTADTSASSLPLSEERGEAKNVASKQTKTTTVTTAFKEYPEKNEQEVALSSFEISAGDTTTDSNVDPSLEGFSGSSLLSSRDAPEASQTVATTRGNRKRAVLSAECHAAKPGGVQPTSTKSGNDTKALSTTRIMDGKKIRGSAVSSSLLANDMNSTTTTTTTTTTTMTPTSHETTNVITTTAMSNSNDSNFESTTTPRTTVDPLTKEIGTAEITTTSSKRGKVSARHSPPPPQILCEALSFITNLSVSVQPGNGTWGGENWKKRLSRKTAPKIVNTKPDENLVLLLPLLEFRHKDAHCSHRKKKEEGKMTTTTSTTMNTDTKNSSSGNGNDDYNCDQEDEWEDLANTLEAILSSSTSNPFQRHLFLLSQNKEQRGACGAKARYGTMKSTSTIRRAACWHTRSHVYIRDYHHDHHRHHHRPSVDGDGESDKGKGTKRKRTKSLSDCIQIFEWYIAEGCAKLIHADTKGSAMTDDGDEEDIDLQDSLFSDDYAGDVVAADGICYGNPPGEKESRNGFDNDGGTLQELVILLEDNNTVITKRFMGDLVRMYCDLYVAGSCDRRNKDRRENLTEDTSSLSKKGNGKGLEYILLRHILSRLPSPTDGGTMSSAEIISRITALSNLLAISPDTAKALAKQVKEEVQAASSVAGEPNQTGREFELAAILRPLLSLSAFTVPDAGMEVVSSSSQSGRRRQKVPLFWQSLNSLPKYPMGVFSKNGMDEAVFQTMTEARNILRASRAVSSMALKKAMGAFGKQARGTGANTGGMFDWISILVRSNDALVNLLKSELLSAEGVPAISSTRPFLLGTTSAVLGLCCQPLMDKFEKMGVAAFDVRYLRYEYAGEKGSKGGKLGVIFDERFLLSSNKTMSTREETKSFVPAQYSGATEFFFLSGALLRVSLFPAIRVRDEFMHVHNKVFSILEDLSSKQSELPSSLREQAQCSVGALLGWKTYLEDEEFIVNVTNFSLLQLRWLVAVTQGSIYIGSSELKTSSKASRTLAMDTAVTLGWIPEWMCKLPAQWLAQVATQTPTMIKPCQAEAAVQCTIELLRAGSMLGRGGKEQSAFSPIVLTELIRVAAAFVHAGVDRAKRKHQRRFRRLPFGASPSREDSELDVDDGDIDIYLSFDANDLGVTVFANPLVSTQLCPVLVHTFSALDVVEGLDVDREHNFDKFMVKGEIAELLLRLWSHPNGECRASIVNLDAATIASFSSAVAAAIGYLLDDACHKLVDACSLMKRRHGSITDKEFYKRQSKGAASFLALSRRMLLLISHLSQETRIARILGSNVSAAADLSSMFIHFIDMLAAADGGTHPGLDFRAAVRPTPTAILADQCLTLEEKEKQTSELLGARHMAHIEYGLDVSILCHQFLALAARWHLAAAEAGSRNGKSSSFLKSVASNDDCNIDQLKNTFRRLAVMPEELSGTELKNASLIFERDGYVDMTVWESKYKPDAASQEIRAQRRLGRLDQISHSKADLVANADAISAFLEDLDHASAQYKATEGSCPTWGEESMEKLEYSILTHGDSLEEAGYAERLGDWVVSSESFLKESTKADFAHYYDCSARAHGRQHIGAGRSMIKEARRCQRTIPTPHPDASTFVCFAEERMDLCRAIVTGPTDTPYAHGVFEFDVFFPPGYPGVPPLVTFMTTGGGQTRFNPNLYQDGKVCLSLLGTWHASNDLERWNPSQSSLAQVLLSIQTQLLVSDPYFNEPGYEVTKGTSAGHEASQRYNSVLRLATLRHAIIGQLRSPPKGFAEVTRRHFSMCRRRVLLQARRWTIEAKGTALYKRFQRAYGELLVLLASDTLNLEDSASSSSSEDEDAGGGKLDHNHDQSETWVTDEKIGCKADTGIIDSKVRGALSPLTHDAKAMERLDPKFHRKCNDFLQRCAGKDRIEPSGDESNDSLVDHARKGGGTLESGNPNSNIVVSVNSTGVVSISSNPWAHLNDSDNANRSSEASISNIQSYVGTNTNNPDDSDGEDLYS